MKGRPHRTPLRAPRSTPPRPALHPPPAKGKGGRREPWEDKQGIGKSSTRVLLLLCLHPSLLYSQQLSPPTHRSGSCCVRVVCPLGGDSTSTLLDRLLLGWTARREQGRGGDKERLEEGRERREEARETRSRGEGRGKEGHERSRRLWEEGW